VVRADSIQAFEALLPDGPRFRILSEALDAFAPSHLEWDVTIELAERHARPAGLDGRTRLGWTSWSRPGGGDRIRADVHLRKRAPRLRRKTGIQP
jgi:predicted component of type VI protein secretion system